MSAEGTAQPPHRPGRTLPGPVLLLHWGTRGGGPQLHAGLADALRGRVPIALSLDRSSECAPALDAQRLPTLRTGGRSTAGRLLRQPLDAVRLARFCRRHRVDVIVEIMDHPLHLVPRLLARRLGVRVVGAVHDAQAHPGEEHRLLAAVAAWSLRSLDVVLVFSGAVAAAVRHRTRAPVVETIHPALGRRQASRSAPAAAVTVGLLGRLLPYKGVPRLLAAVAMLRERGLDVSTRIVGDGSLALDDAALAAASATVDRRWVPVGDLQTELARFDVLALPYDEASQSGVVGLAWSSGVPVVATPIGGLVDQVTAGGGVVATSMDDASFADAVEAVVGDADRYESASRQGLAAADASWSRVADDVLHAVGLAQAQARVRDRTRRRARGRDREVAR